VTDTLVVTQLKLPVVLRVTFAVLAEVLLSHGRVFRFMKSIRMK
jgi:hypothetical protein